MTIPYVVDVDFGAVGDGIADDTTAMTNAAATGMLVYCLGHAYKLSSNVSGNFFFTKAVSYTSTGVLHSIGFQQPSSGQFWSNNGAAINRLNDRAFFGDATASDGAFPSVANDWLTTYMDAYTSLGYANFAQTISMTSVGGGFLGAARTAKATSAGANAYGVTAFGLANNATYSSFAWGYYGESHRVNSTASDCYGMEIAIVNRGGEIATTPYSAPSGTTIGIQIDSGCGFSATQMPGVVSASTGLQFVNNITDSGSAGGFLSGICFGSNSLSGADGTTGTAVAIAMAKGHALKWYSGASTQTSTIICNGVTQANSLNLVFGEGSLILSNASGGQILAAFPSVPNAANYLYLSAATSGSPPVIASGGSDTNIDLSLICKGSGAVRLGVYTAGVSASTGFLTVKDSNGVVRKLLCA